MKNRKENDTPDEQKVFAESRDNDIAVLRLKEDLLFHFSRHDLKDYLEFENRELLKIVEPHLWG